MASPNSLDWCLTKLNFDQFDACCYINLQPEKVFCCLLFLDTIYIGLLLGILCYKIGPS